MKKMFPLIVVSAVVVLASTACRKDDQAPTPTTPTASAYNGQPQGYPQGQPQGYPQGQPQGYPQGQPQGYPQGQPTAYPQPQPTAYPQGQPTAQPVPSAAAAPMGTQGVIPCQSDAMCGLARCNTQVQKCVFPCQNAAVDCIQGAQCVMGACVPKVPGT